MTRLLTLGCSWIAGIGSKYDPSWDKQTYKENCFRDKDNWENAFRTILSKKHGLVNVNISCGGASNGSQFRKFRKYLHQNDLNDTIVLWGVTSIYRMELFFNHAKEFTSGHGYSCFQPNQEKRKHIHGPDWCGPKEYFRQHFHEHIAGRALAEEVHCWQRHFEALNVPQIWFDTLNVNNYVGGVYKPFDKLPYNCNQDLLSQLAYKNGWDPTDDKYHMSNWKADCDRVDFLKKKGILNPYSFHPTIQGHQQIAEILDPILTKCYTSYKELNPNPKPYITKWKDVH